MTEAADLLLVGAEVHALTEPDDTREAVAVRDGEIVRLGRTGEVRMLEGVETRVIDCEGRVVLPGFVDAHVHMEQLGQHLVHADLSGAERREECVDLLEGQAEAEPEREWILGFGYDESEWFDTGRGQSDAERESTDAGEDADRADEGPGRLTRADLDRVSEDRPVVAMRVDLHTASLNSVALARLGDDLPDEDLVRDGGEPTGIAVERAAEAVRRELAADTESMRELLVAAADHAVARGATCVHDKVRGSTAPQVYRALDAADELPLRVRIDYWSDHLDALVEVGLTTNAGSEFVETGAIKTFSDGSIGSRTAKLTAPYADFDPTAAVGDGSGTVAAGERERDDGRGRWVVDPGDLRDVVQRADAAGFQVAVHAIGDEAIEETLAALEATADPGAARHRIEHAELATDDHLRRMAEAGIVASMQPNFHRWTRPGGLYDRRLGPDRRDRTNRFRDVLDAGVPLGFGSDCMPLDPLLGIHHAVNAPTEPQRLSVTEALRAYTLGAAYAGFDEDRLGTIEVGKRADLVALEESPWEEADRIDEIGVWKTIVDGRVVHSVDG